VALKPGQQPAPFYYELQDVLRDVNARRLASERVSFRRAVVDGSYKPTIDRLVNLANLLGVAPTTFDSYVRRWAHEVVDTDPTFLELFRLLASQNESVQGLLKRGIKNHASKLMEAAATTNPKPAALVA
jgi:hypothetical protein